MATFEAHGRSRSAPHAARRRLSALDAMFVHAETPTMPMHTLGTMILDPSTLLPPPAMHGRIVAVRIEKDVLVQVFGPAGEKPLSPPATSKNYIYWRGGQLSFGKLTMTETDLELVDEDPRDAFDFSVDRWNEQLVAGYSKITPMRGLKAHMPDYNDLPAHKAK